MPAESSVRNPELSCVPVRGGGRPIEVVECGSAEEYQRRLPELFGRIERDGFIILRAWDSSDDTLLAIAEPLGRAQRHPNAEPNGIVRVTPERDKTYSAGFDRIMSQSAGEFQPHSDGSYLDGLCVADGAVRRVMPPAMFLLQCVRPAEAGGLSFFIDGQEIFRRLSRDEPQLFALATQPGLISYCGGAQVAMSFPMFAPHAERRWRIRFRSDLMYAQASARERLQELIERYVYSDLLRSYHSLEPREIVICDNLRMLHGREAITGRAAEGPRLLKRLWIWDALSDQHVPLGRTDHTNNAIFDVFRDYAPLPPPPRAAGSPRPAIGIVPQE
jgi:alpha-ketoglutarate-dependent taurine dioxygenase